MSDFEFVLVHGNDFNLQTNVFEFVIGGGRGAKGEKGDTGSQGEQGVQGDVGPAGPGRQISLDPHGIVSSGTEEISFNSTNHSLTGDGNSTLEFIDDAENQPDTSIEIPVISATTFTTPASASFYSTQTLSALTPVSATEPRIYQVEIFSFQPRLKFDAGANEILIGDVLTGVTSGNTGTVTEVVLMSGSWAGNDAAGFIRMDYGITGIFQNDENLTSTRLTPTVHAIANEVAGKYGIAVGVKQ